MACEGCLPKCSIPCAVVPERHALLRHNAGSNTRCHNASFGLKLWRDAKREDKNATRRGMVILGTELFANMFGVSGSEAQAAQLALLGLSGGKSGSPLPPHGSPIT